MENPRGFPCFRPARLPGAKPGFAITTGRAWARRLFAFVVTLAAVAIGFAGPAMAQVDREIMVVLLRPVPTEPLLAESIVRIKSELLAGGFEVTVADTPSNELVPDARTLKQLAARTQPPSATLAIFGDLAQGTAELWVADRITGRSVIRRVQVETSSDRPISEVLAIRVQELLRATLVEVSVEEARPQPLEPAPPVVVAKQPASEVKPILPWQFGLEAGGSVFGGAGGFGTAEAPVLRLRFAIDETFWLRLGALGFGTQPRLVADYASATLSQTLVLLEGSARFRTRARVQPLLSVGMGSERVAVDTSTHSPYRGHQNARWYFAADVGAGLALRLAAHWEAQLEGHMWIAAPRPEVRFLGNTFAQAGLPTFLATLTVAGGR